MEESLLDILYFNSWSYHEGWRNGKSGSISCHSDEKWIFRFYEPIKDISGRWDYWYKPRDEFPIVCDGIAGCWLSCRRKSSVREIYDYYTSVRYEQYKEEFRDYKDIYTNWYKLQETRFRTAYNLNAESRKVGKRTLSFFRIREAQHFCMGLSCFSQNRLMRKLGLTRR